MIIIIIIILIIEGKAPITSHQSNGRDGKMKKIVMCVNQNLFPMNEEYTRVYQFCQPLMNLNKLLAPIYSVVECL